MENTYVDDTFTGEDIQEHGDEEFVWPNIPPAAEYWRVVGGPYDVGGEVFDYELASALIDTYRMHLPKNPTAAHVRAVLADETRLGEFFEVEGFVRKPPPEGALEDVLSWVADTLDGQMPPGGAHEDEAEFDYEPSTREENLTRMLAEVYLQRWKYLRPCGTVRVNVLDWADAPGNIELLLSIPDQ